MIEIIINGERKEISNTQKNKIQDLFYLAIKDARSMPAFGVAFNDLVKKEIQEGIWISIKFDKLETVNGMPFDELLVKIDKGWYGFNLIRGIKNKYDGRCFYLDLNNNNLDSLYDYISLLKNDLNDIDKGSESIEEKIFLCDEIIKVLSF